MQPSHCTPLAYKKAIASKKRTCVPDGILKQLALALSLPLGDFVEDLIERIHLALKTEKESEWPDHPEVRKANPELASFLMTLFRPKQPLLWRKNPNAWLSNYDILAVMHQYHESTPGFRFVGVFPSDFQTRSREGTCVSSAMCDLTVRKMINVDGIRKLGFVFNLDKHTGRGSHWTSMFIGLDPSIPDRFGAYYFDSIGRAPMAQVASFQRRIHAEVASELGEDVGKRFVVCHNRHRKQYGNTECGIYSMFFIVACISTRNPVEQICREMIKDDSRMQHLRSIYFR